MNIKTDQEINILLESGQILAKVLGELKKQIKPGVNGAYLDKLAEKIIRESNAEPAFLGYGDYPNTICLSINDEIVHGLPTADKIIKEGDIVNVDCGVKYRGWCTDAAFTVGVGKISPKLQKLITTTQDSLEQAIKAIKPGVKISEIQRIIQNTLEKDNLGIIKDLSGHGIGQSVHEAPSIHNYVGADPDFTLKKGLVFCIEPMASLGTDKIRVKKDGWTIETQDNSIAAHFEHTIAVTESGYKILTK